MRFAAPLWLAALAALALPLLIHFLSRGYQRRVRVGSVRLLQPAAGRRGRRPRLTEPGLLALRAGLLAALALALAGPRWPGDKKGDEEPPGWLLVAPDAVRALGEDAVLSARFERLRGEGHQARRLESGLEPGLPEAKTPSKPDLPPRALWSLLREADALAPAGAPFFVFAGAPAADLDGVRPSLRRRIEWPAASAEPAAEEAAGDGLGDRTPRPNPDAPSRPLAVAIVVAPERAGEERYLRAAFAARAAIAEDGNAGIAIQTSAAVAGTAGGSAPVVAAVADAVRVADLVFWLSEEPLPAVVAERVRGGGVGVVARAGDALPCDRLLLAGIAGLEHRVALRRCPADPAQSGPPGAAVWRDDGGTVRLTVESLGAGLLFRHAGAFDPAAGDFVVGAAFPEWIRELAALARQRGGLPAADAGVARWRHAAVAGSQAAPRSLTSEPSAGAAAGPVESRDAARARWLLVALLLATERLVAARRAP